MSINEWQEKEQAPSKFGEGLPEFSGLTKNLLWQRGIKKQEKIDKFFNPDYSTDLHDPFLLKDAQKAVERIFEALERKEKVVVYGDYDSDGVCGATIMRNALFEVGFREERVGIYMPDREKEGYGLKEDAVEKFVKEKYNLIITVDCGTTSHKAIEVANSSGMDTIVTDHHRVIGSPPPAYAFVNPHQEGDEYPFKDLCGAAVAFKIACALYKKRNIEDGREKWFLDLVAMATVTDVMPLIDENRTLVRYGLFVLAQAQRHGLRALMEVSGIQPSFNEDSLTTNLKPWSLGFILGPRLNAAGRIDHANTAFALLNAKSYEEAIGYAKDVDDRNRERQELVSRILGEAEDRVKPKGGQTPLDLPVVFEGDASWPIGVVGLVAGKIAEKYYRPSFIYQVKEDGSCAGSVRTIPGFHVVKALESVADILINFGGHPEAGGFTVSQDNLDEMKDRIDKFARKNLKEEDYIKKVKYSLEVKPQDISWEVYEEIERFEPFGEANREPVFLLKNLEVNDIATIGKTNGNGNKKHLRLQLGLPKNDKRSSSSKNSVKALAFGMGERVKELSIDGNIDVLFNLAIDEWNGSRELMLRIVDFKVKE